MFFSSPNILHFSHKKILTSRLFKKIDLICPEEDNGLKEPEYLNEKLFEIPNL